MLIRCILIRCVVATIFATITATVNAELPSSISCKSIAVSEEASIPVTDKSSLIFIHNLSKIDLWLTPEIIKSESNEEKGEASRLQAGRWSALLLNGVGLKLNCVESRPGHEQMVPCQGVISMCRSTLPKIPAHFNEFWVGENVELAHLIEYLGSRGFELDSGSKDVN